ncbi:hypothetical protein Ngar_c24190 [Candidatus Nitrososphaera gargensis Ga9.2]|uniref:Uncharacterized protein n=1 Tax=Nitrososphaera gargensis (strain Ga9.2) TaxID=1237085 RepID=K0IJI4_NITGG|nr:hypothetical protein Ngar_c24190 [Candidatus Nitrososphaera gargensis Ga9.2]
MIPELVLVPNTTLVSPILAPVVPDHMLKVVPLVPKFLFWCQIWYHWYQANCTD